MAILDFLDKQTETNNQNFKWLVHLVNQVETWKIAILHIISYIVLTYYMKTGQQGAYE